MPFLGRAVGALGLVILAGCSSNPNTGNACPAIIAAPSADSVFLFGPGGHERKDVIIVGKIYDLTDSCTRVADGLSVDTQISFYAERVSNLVKDTTFPYFVALVDPSQRVLAQNAYTVPVQFLPGEAARRTPPEKITVHLPMSQRAGAASYTVVVGFQLTPDQIAFNRSVLPYAAP
jgi:hypothetical protein